MLKRSYQFVLFMVIVCTIAYTAMGQSPSGLNKAKLTDPERIVKPFEQGESFVRVTVNLSQGRDTLAKTNWQSQESLSVLRERIRQRQQQVLSNLTQDELLLRHRSENLASFSAEVETPGNRSNGRPTISPPVY